MNFRKALADKLEATNTTAYALAKYLGVYPSTVYRYLDGGDTSADLLERAMQWLAAKDQGK